MTALEGGGAARVPHGVGRGCGRDLGRAGA